jgi:AcrR family transcriptional regulator
MVPASTVARRRLTKDERRELILSAAARVFAERGYESASLDEIAEAAGISKPVIYDHFDSKRDLHISLLDGFGGDLLAFMTERAVQGRTAEDQLRRGLDAVLEFAETNPFAWRLIFRDPPAADAKIVEIHDQHQRQTTEAIAALVGAQLADRQPGDVDAGVAAEVTAVMLKWATTGVAAWWYEHRELPRERVVELMMDFAWVGQERVLAGERWRQKRA